MSLKKSKTPDGHVNAENISGSKVPRKGLADETKGKGVGSRDIRKVNGLRANFVNRLDK